MTRIPALIFLLFTLCFGSLAAHASTTFSKVVAFGDSLSDTGNGIALVHQQFPQLAGLNLPPPFLENRASNGPVAIELLADMIANEPLESFFVNPPFGTNFSILSARAVGDDDGNRLIDLSAQVGLFLSTLSAQGGAADSNALYVIFIGGNDILDIRNAPREDANSAIDAALTAIQTNIQLLASVGARHFLIVNLPKVHGTPRILNLAETDPDVKSNVRKTTKRFNRKLHKELRKMRKTSDLNIMEFDLFSLSRFVLKHPRIFGFKVSKEGCIGPYDTLNLLLGVETVQYAARCGVNGENINKFVFVDNLHFTSRASEIIAWSMYAKIAYFSKR